MANKLVYMKREFFTNDKRILKSGNVYNLPESVVNEFGFSDYVEIPTGSHIVGNNYNVQTNANGNVADFGNLSAVLEYVDGRFSSRDKFNRITVNLPAGLVDTSDFAIPAYIDLIVQDPELVSILGNVTCDADATTNIKMYINRDQVDTSEAIECTTIVELKALAGYLESGVRTAGSLDSTGGVILVTADIAKDTTILSPKGGVYITTDNPNRQINVRICSILDNASDLVILENFVQDVDDLGNLTDGVGIIPDIDASTVNMFCNGTFILRRSSLYNTGQTVAGNTITIVDNGNVTKLDAYDCKFENGTVAGSDVVSTKAEDSGIAESESIVNLYNCDCKVNSDGANDQAVTGHQGFDVNVYGGSMVAYSTDLKAVEFVTGANVSIYGAYIEGVILSFTKLEYCVVTVGSLSDHQIYMKGETACRVVGNHITVEGAGSTTIEVICQPTCSTAVECVIAYNYLEGLCTAAYIPDATDAHQIWYVHNNYFKDVNRGIDFRTSCTTTGEGLCYSYNNIIDAVSHNHLCSSGNDRITSDYNMYENAIVEYGSHATGSNTVNATPDLDADGLSPIPFGNIYKAGTDTANAIKVTRDIFGNSVNGKPSVGCVHLTFNDNSLHKVLTAGRKPRVA